MDGKADLHLHTVYSDGTFTPRDLVHRAALAGLTTISITDHDHTGAIEEARAAGAERAVTVISGVELSTVLGELEIHILGYFFDHTNAGLQAHLERFRRDRMRRAAAIVENLNRLGIPITLEAVLSRTGKGSVGRPHIARALVEEGFTQTYHEAFGKYIGFGKPAFEKKSAMTPGEAIAMIAGAGGLSFVAHPGTNIEEKVLLTLIHDGVDGIEAVHPSHSRERIAHYKGVASEYFLLTSGGSDFHGARPNDAEILGTCTITEEDVEMMRRRLRRG